MTKEAKTARCGKRPMRLAALLAAALLTAWPARGALEFYGDAPDGVRTGTVRGAAETGATETDGRRIWGVKLNGGALWFAEDTAPTLTGDWSLHFRMEPAADRNEPAVLLCRAGVWTLEYRPARQQLALKPVKGREAVFALPTDFAARRRAVTLVQRRGELLCWIDARLAGRRPAPVLRRGDAQMLIGAANNQLDRPFFGRIDGISCWSHALALEEVKALTAGDDPLELAARKRRKRTVTTPEMTSGELPERPAAMNLRRAVIAVPEGAGGRALAERVRRLLQTAWRVKLPLRTVRGHADGREPLILCGSPLAGPVACELAANGQIPDELAGPEWRCDPRALDWRRGVLYLGGRNGDEVAAAVASLLKRFPHPDGLPFAVGAPVPKELPDPAALTAAAGTAGSGRGIREVLTPLFEAWRATGDDRFAAAYGAALQKLAERGEPPPVSEFHRVPRQLYLVEASPAFSPAMRRTAVEWVRRTAENILNSPEFAPLTIDYAMGRRRYPDNRNLFAARTLGVAARYLKSRCGLKAADYWLAVARHAFAAVPESPLAPVDAVGEQYLACGIYLDDQLAAGTLEPAFFRSAAFRASLEYAKMSVNHLGWSAGYGDGGRPTGMREARSLLRAAALWAGDREAAAIEALNRLPSLPPPSSPRLTGLRVFTLSGVRQKWMGVPPARLPRLDKAVFRGSWLPDGSFLTVNGINGGPHGHGDAMGVGTWVRGGYLWLLEGNPVRRFAEDHNLLTVIRNGQAPERRPGRLARSERAAQVAGSVVAGDRRSAALSLLLENCNGVDWFRHFGWEADGGLWVLDELVARQAGNYRFAARWRTTGEVVPGGQGVTVRQRGGLAGPPVMTLSEGGGAARFGYSELERMPGQAAGLLEGYAGSDGVTRTRLFWRDAVLRRGERVVFAWYFRTAADGTAQPLEVKRIADRLFAVDDGGRRKFALAGNYDGHGLQLRCRAAFWDDAGRREVIDGRDFDAAAATDRLNAAEKSWEVRSAAPARSGRPEDEAAAVVHFGAEISAVASGRRHAGIGLADGEFRLIDRDGVSAFTTRLDGPVSAVSAIDTPDGECWAVGVRRPDGAGRLYWLTADGRELWRREIAGADGGAGTPRTIFAARLDDGGRPASIVVGTEDGRYCVWELSGRERWTVGAGVGATAGIAADLDGDGRDEMVAGTEAGGHWMLESDGRMLRRLDASPGTAALLAVTGVNGVTRVLAGQSDGFLYFETAAAADREPVNLGGPAVALRRLPSGGVAAAVGNGFLVLLDADGRRTGGVTLPSPLSDLSNAGLGLWAAALDGRVYGIDPEEKKVRRTVFFAADEQALTPPRLVGAGETVYVGSGRRLFRLPELF